MKTHISEKSDCKLRIEGSAYCKPLRGFTLVELLVVISIIALLLAILMPVLRKAREQAQKTICLANLKQTGIAFGIYFANFDDYFPPCWQSPAPGGYAYGVIAGETTTYSTWYHLVGRFLLATQTKKTYGGAIYHCPSVSGSFKKSDNCYGYNFRVLSPWGDKDIWGEYKAQIHRIARPGETVMVCDAGAVWENKSLYADPVDWPPMANNPGFGEVSFPGDCQWNGIYMDKTVTCRSLARHSGKVSSMFLDGHAESVDINKLLNPKRGKAGCLYDAE